ncbi:slit homolog 1 protein-like [Belonocnema kinseyi]|uniref:slit homolog 1 protein-like n=1 Tax=Belonocnema kinseyi TaxID=2817044 RepID=UPI00143DB657|nr:slit homolog 1 protein-like [Belonocnema kinseyi]
MLVIQIIRRNLDKPSNELVIQSNSVYHIHAFVFPHIKVKLVRPVLSWLVLKRPQANFARNRNTVFVHSFSKADGFRILIARTIENASESCRMLLFSFLLLLPLVARAEESSLKPYTLEIENGTLTRIIPREASIEKLDLSNLQIKFIKIEAFDDLKSLKSLVLRNNLLTSLPEFVFSNLTSLEYLCLAENKIHTLENIFIGLDNLKTLNISSNPLRHLRRGQFFGLPSNINIYTRGNIFWSLSTMVFENPFLKEKENLADLERARFGDNPDEVQVAETRKLDSLDREIFAGLKTHVFFRETDPQLDKDIRIKLCLEDGIVLSLQMIEKDDKIEEKCSEVKIDYEERQVNLRGLGIKDFEEDWYQLQKLPIIGIDLSNNEIQEISKEFLNDLPGDLASVSLVENLVRKIPRQVIDNSHLKVLNLMDNLIEEIEEKAFENTRLTGLFLGGNRLENINFVKDLPSTLTDLILNRNLIQSIPDGIFTRLTNLVYLNLAKNSIPSLQSDTFRGLKSLQVLILTRNSLSNIALGSFKYLKNLKTLFLYHNSISTLPNGVFENLDKLRSLHLAFNKIKKITQDMFTKLPKSINFLHLDFNKIESMEPGSFIEVPKFSLSLDGNKISNILPGTFNLPNLQDLYLRNNSLAILKSESYEGLPRLKRLWLSNNKINNIEKGAARSLSFLTILDISKNPVKRLENGALFGLPKSRASFIYIADNSIDLIQGGVFDDYNG